MFACVTGFHIKEDEVEAAIKVYRDEVIPMRQAGKGSEGKGSIGGYLLVDRKTGKGFAITLWDRAEDNIAADKSLYYEEPKSKFKSHLASSHVDWGLYEVCTQG
ncbi:hypothetical protein ACFLVP_01050 [Chloroflexota bacterium]